MMMTYLLCGNQHFVQESKPFEQKYWLLMVRYLLVGFLIQCQTVG